MPRYYRSPLGIVARWTMRAVTLMLFFTGLEWIAIKVLPVVLPFLLVGALVAIVAWAINQLR